MVVPILPIPGVTPGGPAVSYQWAVELNAGITDAFAEVTTETDTYGMAGVELASAEVSYSFATTMAISPATAAAVIGAMIIVPATTTPVQLEFGGSALITTAGAGLLQLQVWEGVGTFTVPTYGNAPATAANVSIFTGYSGNGFRLFGLHRLEPSATDRTFFLAGTIYRDGGSSLAASIANTPENPSYLRAVAM